MFRQCLSTCCEEPGIHFHDTMDDNFQSRKSTQPSKVGRMLETFTGWRRRSLGEGERRGRQNCQLLFSPRHWKEIGQIPLFHFRSKSQPLEATDDSYHSRSHLLKKDLEQKDFKSPIYVLLPHILLPCLPHALMQVKQKAIKKF